MNLIYSVIPAYKKLMRNKPFGLAKNSCVLLSELCTSLW